jgi:hypothetical protein
MGVRLKEFYCNFYHRTKCVKLVKHIILGIIQNAYAYQIPLKVFKHSILWKTQDPRGGK